jgi:hypothetical protein
VLQVFIFFKVYIWVFTWSELRSFSFTTYLLFSFFLFQLRVTPYLLQICLWMLLLTSLCRLLQDLGLLNLMVCKSEVIRLVSCLFL